MRSIINCRTAVLVIIGACGFATVARAGISYNESVGGDLSNNKLAPTPFTLDAGSNTITATFGATATPEVYDQDFFSATIPAGKELYAAVLLSADIGGGASFIGLGAGNQIAELGSASGLLGWTHFGSASAGTDLLPVMRAGPGAIGFGPTLPAGTYTFWVQELNTDRSYSYALELRVRAVPGPGTGSVLCGIGLLGARRSKRSKVAAR